ncbi:hypothetical protein [Herbidospora yilanensis]|uniref:hypothetical protein n=1 Tax=Herbidospora yilanensis TaxID=354426 RepID=UPI000785803E|nr:hypothetical protein [Herbidospora yilanensis]
MKPTDQVLRDLAEASDIAVRTSSELVGKVRKAAAKDDAKRKQRDDRLRRKTDLTELPRSSKAQSLHLPPWHVLHELAHALSLSRQGASRGLAEHWGSLKYSQALDSESGFFMELSGEGKSNVAQQYKRIQSQELGHGFARLLTRHILRQRHPDHFVSIVSADVVLKAGWANRSYKYNYQPDFFAEIWKPGEPSLVIPIAAKGNHDRRPITSHNQLASCSAHAEAVVIGELGETPALLFSTELSPEGPLTVHALESRGEGGWLLSSERSRLDVPLLDKGYLPGIEGSPDDEPGFHVNPERFGWFQHVLARTAAAGVTAFAGDGGATVQYLTKRQGSGHYRVPFAHAATGSVRDATYTFFGIRFVGTDHVFRLNNKRVEAFSGVVESLFDLLSEGRVEEYRRRVYAQRGRWCDDKQPSGWKGPISVHDDGTVLAMRRLLN